MGGSQNKGVSSWNEREEKATWNMKMDICVTSKMLGFSMNFFTAPFQPLAATNLSTYKFVYFT